MIATTARSQFKAYFGFRRACASRVNSPGLEFIPSDAVVDAVAVARERNIDPLKGRKAGAVAAAADKSDPFGLMAALGITTAAARLQNARG